MKKFLKIFIIVLLVGSVIGGTCYFFFRNLEKNNHTTSSIASYLMSEEKQNFNNSLYEMHNLANSDSTDSRLALIAETNFQLDDMMMVVCSFYVENNTKINDKEISNSFNQLKSSQTLLMAMVNEYKIKSTSNYFDRHVGANDYYKQACSYLMQYASFVNLVSENINVINKSVDVRFSMINLYSNVVINTFKSTKEMSNRVDVTNKDNINWINLNVVFENSCLDVTNAYSSNANNFIKFYSACNKSEFASNLKSNITTASKPNQSSTAEQSASYYLKELVK